MKIVKIYPGTSKFHFGYLGLDIDDIIFHSDSLFSTLVINYIRKFGQENLQNFVSNFPKISSLFYGYRSNQKDILFIPKPTNFRFPEKMFNDDRKIPKKIKFVSLGCLINKDQMRTNTKKDICYTETDEDIKLFERHIEEKVSIDRKTWTTKEDALYSVSYVIPNKNTFFYFLIDGEISKELEESIMLIKNFGLGGKTSHGSGKIDNIEINDIEIELNINSNSYTNLSVVFLDNSEFNDENILYYKLIERKGWIFADNLRKNNIIGLAEGSVFRNKINGKIEVEDVGNKKIYRYGKASLLPMVIENEKI